MLPCSLLLLKYYILASCFILLSTPLNTLHTLLQILFYNALNTGAVVPLRGFLCENYKFSGISFKSVHI